MPYNWVCINSGRRPTVICACFGLWNVSVDGQQETWVDWRSTRKMNTRKREIPFLHICLSFACGPDSPWILLGACAYLGVRNVIVDNQQEIWRSLRRLTFNRKDEYSNTPFLIFSLCFARGCDPMCILLRICAYLGVCNVIVDSQKETWCSLSWLTVNWKDAHSNHGIPFLYLSRSFARGSDSLCILLRICACSGVRNVIVDIQQETWRSLSLLTFNRKDEHLNTENSIFAFFSLFYSLLRFALYITRGLHMFGGANCNCGHSTRNMTIIESIDIQQGWWTFK